MYEYSIVLSGTDVTRGGFIYERRNGLALPCLALVHVSMYDVVLVVLLSCYVV